jgi:hypothetical protein
MPDPILYEINTRCWLRELSQRHGTEITLANVPPAVFDGWQQLGFTHIWLMGVWTTGPRARALALNHPELRKAYYEVLPDWREEDVSGSPYAVADYRVARALGGDEGLEKFRRQLHAHGLKLILDFVSNHVGLDHVWVSQRPEFFVQSPAVAPDTFEQETRLGKRRLAHGKDPNFPGWTDTVQVDYRRADARAAMLGLLQAIATRCDGVRCDMAMLLLNDIFAKTWAHLPVRHGKGPAVTSDFWADAVPAVKQVRPDFLFLAEVYWGLEGRLQSLGFDYTYDKMLYDLLLARSGEELQRHLLDASPEYICRSAHFLENHDEPRIASRLSPSEHRAAALLMLGLPGMRFLHEGQLTGSTIKVPVQLGRRPVEKAGAEIAAIYEKLLTTLRESAVGHGQGKLLRPRRAWDDNPTAENCVVVQWQSQPPEFELVVVNLAPHRGQCYVPLEIRNLAGYNWRMQDLLGEERYERFGDDLQRQGLYLDVPAHAAQLFRFTPI